jgi:hypothetical protein
MEKNGLLFSIQHSRFFIPPNPDAAAASGFALVCDSFEDQTFLMPNVLRYGKLSRQPKINTGCITA